LFAGHISEGKPFKLFGINALYWLVAMYLSAAFWPSGNNPFSAIAVVQRRCWESKSKFKNRACLDGQTFGSECAS